MDGLRTLTDYRSIVGEEEISEISVRERFPITLLMEDWIDLWRELLL